MNVSAGSFTGDVRSELLHLSAIQVAGDFVMAGSVKTAGNLSMEVGGTLELQALAVLSAQTLAATANGLLIAGRMQVTADGEPTAPLPLDCHKATATDHTLRLHVSLVSLEAEGIIAGKPTA